MKTVLSAPYLDRESFLLRGWAGFFSSLTMGITFVFAGVKVPTHKSKRVRVIAMKTVLSECLPTF